MQYASIFVLWQLWDMITQMNIRIIFGTVLKLLDLH